MGLGALFTLADIARSSLKEKKLVKLLRDKGVDERIIEDAKGAIGYFSISERDRVKIYEANPGVDRIKAETRLKTTVLYIFQFLDVAELVLGNRKKAEQAHQEAIAFFAMIERQKSEKALSLSQAEARILRFSIINYVDKLTLSDEERNQLREIADFLRTKTDPILSQGNITLSVSNDMLMSLDGLLHMFQIDSEMAYTYGSIGADSFVGDSGVRLSEMASYIPMMERLIARISEQIE